MTDGEFEKLVAEGIDAIPLKYQRLMQNVVIVIEDEPSGEVHQHGGEVLFGLYEGVPLTERGSEYSELPDKITIFKNPILARYSDPADVRECVANTVWHEIAHHFGFDEEWVHQEEEKRGKTK